MKRDPAERYIKERMDSIGVKKIRPLFYGVNVRNVIKNLEES